MIDTRSMIFVFGSNEAGIHGAGAARYAYEKKGAIWGHSYGPIDKTFAIPTKGFKIGTNRRPYVGDTLEISVIRRYVDGFLAFASRHPDLNFQVTCIGCGLAGLKHDEIAPMFREHSPNCYFDLRWAEYLPAGTRFWGTF